MKKSVGMDGSDNKPGGTAYVMGAARQATSVVDGVMQTKVPLMGTVGDVAHGVASRIPVVGSAIEIAQEAAAAAGNAAQPGRSRTQVAASLSKSLVWIAIRRHPLFAVAKLALYGIAAFALAAAAVMAWWFLL